MVEFKLVMSAKDGKSFQKQITGKEAEALLGKKVRDKISGDKIGFGGYEFEITGGSDMAGFPMRKGVRGFGRKKVLLSKGVGFNGKTRWKKKKKGLRVKKTVCGETIYPKITQINLKILKQGAEALGEEKKEEAPAEEKKEEKKEAKPEPKKEVPKEEKPAPEAKAETPVKTEEKKEEVKKEEKKEEPKAEEKKETPAEEKK